MLVGPGGWSWPADEGLLGFPRLDRRATSWFLRCVTSAPHGLLADDCSVFIECADWYFPNHQEVLANADRQVELFDRQKYLAHFGESPDMQEMAPTPHRVLHAWRGKHRTLLN